MVMLTTLSQVNLFLDCIENHSTYKFHDRNNLHEIHEYRGTQKEQPPKVDSNNCWRGCNFVYGSYSCIVDQLSA